MHNTAVGKKRLIQYKMCVMILLSHICFVAHAEFGYFFNASRLAFAGTMLNTELSPEKSYFNDNDIYQNFVFAGLDYQFFINKYLSILPSVKGGISPLEADVHSIVPTTISGVNANLPIDKKAVLKSDWIGMAELTFRFNFGAYRVYGFITPGYTIMQNSLTLAFNTSPVRVFRSQIVSAGPGATIGIGYLMSRESDLTLGYSLYSMTVQAAQSETNDLTNLGNLHFLNNTFYYEGISFTMRFHF
tara:strand:- start:7161 stop:7895 length:735 start_codon:yes stop_codon:yes gene_type:complete